jgi:hypothetical protein
MRKITKRTAAIATAAVIGVGAVGTTAWAGGWFKSGNSNVSVAAGNAGQINATIFVSDQLYPTVSVEAFGKADNPNPYKVKVTGFTVNSLVSGPAGCDTPALADLHVDPPINLWIIAAGATQGTGNGANLGKIVRMGQYAADACEGKTLKINVSLTGTPVA